MPRSTSPVMQAARRVGHPQMAFVRAWAEGVDLLLAAQRYLGQGIDWDLRHARSELQALLDVLRSVARAQGRPELAALLQRDPEAMVEAGSDRPSLDDFRAQQPEDFYSEAELLALYQAEHGAPDARSGTRRRQRLRARQLDALQWLEGLAVRDPRPDDALASWMDERLAARLGAVGLKRLDQLLAWIRTRGFHWHRPIPRVGAAAAARVLHWLRQHERTLGTLPPWALLPRAQLDAAALMARPGTAPAAQATPVTPSTPAALSGPPLPLERLGRLRLPAALSGQTGLHRAATVGVQPWAVDDLSAVQAWLGQRTPGSATWRAYRKEAERLLLWAWWVAGKPVSSLDAADLPAYQAFLAAPPKGWTAPRGTPRWHDDWRPFEGPLSERSALMALGIVRGMLDAWVVRGYLAVNSWTGKPRTVRSRTVDWTESPRPAAVACDLARRPEVQAQQERAAGFAEIDTAIAVPDLSAAQTPNAGQASSPVGPRRSLTPDQQSAMSAWLSQQMAKRGATPALLRLNALWAVACDTGLRPAELVAARTGWVRWTDRAGQALQQGPAPSTDHATWLQIPDNRTAGAARQVLLGGASESALLRYLASRRVEPSGQPASLGPSINALGAATDAPLFAHLRSDAALSPARLYELMAQAFADCARDLAATDSLSAAAIRRASTHWLRHGFGLEAARAGLDTAALQHRMGHRSRASASAYRRALKLTAPAAAVTLTP